MWSSRPFASALLIAVSVATAIGHGVQEPTFRSEGTVVPVFATVTDSEQHLVTDLMEDEFEVLDNGKPQKLTVFDNRYRPISIIVLLDNSLSMEGNKERLREAAEQFVIRLFPKDEAKMGAFHARVEIAGQFTSNRDDLIGELRHLDFGNNTLLYDGLNAGLDALQDARERKVILVFTDGEDSGSKSSAGPVLDRARADETMIYVIALESHYVSGGRMVTSRPDSGLKKIAEETGGGFFLLNKADNLGATFTRVAQELHSQYVMGFNPGTLDNKVHKLIVRAKRPGLTARARRSYLATPTRNAGKEPRKSGGL